MPIVPEDVKANMWGAIIAGIGLLGAIFTGLLRRSSEDRRAKQEKESRAGLEKDRQMLFDGQQNELKRLRKANAKLENYVSRLQDYAHEQNHNYCNVVSAINAIQTLRVYPDPQPIPKFEGWYDDALTADDAPSQTGA